MARSAKYCSFCGRPFDGTVRYVSGPGVAICEDCVRTCGDILRKGASGDASGSTDEEIREIPTPAELKAYLDEYVIGQDAAKRVLSVAVYNHYKRVKYRKEIEDSGVEIDKSNILMIGPTGTGKTLLARTLAKKLDVPFAIADATTLTEAGYVGEDVENILLKLIEAADYDISRAEHGIIFIDEIDKISKKGENVSITRDVSGEGVQQALLKIIEGTVASVPPQGGRKHPNQEMLKINTSNILFICGGAFVGLDKIIEKRVAVSSMGFGAKIMSSEEKDLENLYKELHPDDLIKFGLIPEFIGRIPTYAVLDPLNEKTLKMILTEPKNAVLKQYKCLLEMDGVDLEFEPEAIDLIAQEALKRNTGARALRAIVEEIMLDVMYDVPSKENNGKVVITADMVKNRNTGELIQLPTKNDSTKEITA